LGQILTIQNKNSISFRAKIHRKHNGLLIRLSKNFRSYEAAEKWLFDREELVTRQSKNG
jgi:hypothetical protein